MLSLKLKTFPYLHRPIPHPLSPLKIKPFLPFPSPKPSPPLSISLSTTTAATITTDKPPSMAEIIEHVVLFKVRDSADPTAMISHLRSLSSLPLAAHLTAGPILRPRSSAASDLGFTHLLHSRYRSKSDLSAYASHPDHVSVVKNQVLPVCDDVMALDWVSSAAELPAPAPGSALRLTLAKPKEGSAAAELLGAIAGAGGAQGLLQLSYGENFSPARSKGYEVGMIAVFPGVEEMERALEGPEAEAAKEKVRPLLESVIVLDYVVPAPAEAAASL